MSEGENLVLAQPINGRLPLFQVNKVPEELLKDRRMQRDVSHRYYFLEHRDWQTNQRRPLCEIIECIGEGGNLQAETLRLLRYHDICADDYEAEGGKVREFECLKPFINQIDASTGEWKIPEEEIGKRLDLRKQRVVSIDPITARDLDDALSITKISAKVYEIGVHIADVSYFVQ